MSDSSSSVSSPYHPVVKRRRLHHFESRFLDLPPGPRHSILIAARRATMALLESAKKRIRGMTNSGNLSKAVQRELEDVRRAAEIVGLPSTEYGQRLDTLVDIRAYVQIWMIPVEGVPTDEERVADAESEFRRIASAPWEDEECHNGFVYE